jgi:hypothetical protein
MAVVALSSNRRFAVYNLLVTYTQGAWDKGAYEYPRARAIGGYGDPSVADRYKDFGAQAIADLMSFPCLFAYEEGRGDDVRVGWLTAIRPRENTIRIEFELEGGLPPIPHAEIAERNVELDIGGFALSHTHWAVKDIDLIPVLIRSNLVSESTITRHGKDSRIVRIGLTKHISELQIRPSIFRVPSRKIENDLVSVMMPFDARFSDVFKAIKSASAEQSLRCQRADDIWDEAEVIQDVFSLIYRSRVVVCDFTERNPNVFYEAGIAHTLGKTVLPIVQNPADIPFDLQSLRFISYLDNREGRKALKDAVSAKLKGIVTG